MNRREFLAASALCASNVSLLARASRQQTASDPPGAASPRASFETSDPLHQKIYAHALEVLAGNVTLVSGFPAQVLIEGSNYAGIWMECAPLEGLTYAAMRPDVARNNHLALFALQKDDGQIPCWARKTAVGFAQIQMVVPIAATAWDLAHGTGDSELLETAYQAGSRWDAWLRRYRDTRHTGLCEAFCTWDTGHDNSPRWTGMPNRCPDGDARICPPDPSLPRLAPDLSATVYGGRVALAAMARALGRNAEADRWLADAETIRAAILARLYSADDAAFYDIDARDRFVRVRGDVISRVLGEHVVDQATFDEIYRRQIHNPKAFWAPYPLPSIAMDDPAFVRPIPRNSWGGASQALTALRAPRWMEHYGKAADLAHLMTQWVDAIARAGKFLQQMDPVDGAFTDDLGDYSPAALNLVDFTWRLAGVRPDGDGLEWNVRPPAADIQARYERRVAPVTTAVLRYRGGRAELVLNGRVVHETDATVRLVTDRNGALRGAVGTGASDARVTIRHASGHETRFSIAPNQRVSLAPKTT